MAYFALYYVPPADHPFYQLGSQMLGYDVRTGQILPVENAARARLSAEITAIFGEYQTLTVDSVCLLVKPDGADYYQLAREFHRRVYPQPL